MRDAVAGTGVKSKVAGVQPPRPQNAYAFLLAGADLIGTRAVPEIIDALDEMRRTGVIPGAATPSARLSERTSTMRYLVGIDEGTTGCKTCVFDENGTLVGSDYREYPCYYPRPGWVEQTPDDILPALFESCRSAIAQSGVAKEDIAAIALSSQGGSPPCWTRTGS